MKPSEPHYFRIGLRKDGSTEFNTESFLEHVREQRVLVVGVSGKSSVGDGKANFVDAYIQREAFSRQNEACSSSADSSSFEGPFLEGIHDPSSSLIFLHLKHFHDGSLLLEKGIAAMKAKGVQAYLSEGRETSVLLNLFLFHVCHIVIIHFPTPFFDTSYVSLFKTLESLRWEFMDQIINIMDSSDFPQEKNSYGRFLTPRLLFYFPTPPQSFRTPVSLERNAGWRYQDIQMLESSLCSQILTLNKMVMPSATLFKIPTRQEFCFVEVSKDSTLRHDSFTVDWNRLNSNMRSFEADDDYGGDPFVPYYEDIAMEDSRKKKNFSRFLHNHISWMWSRSKGNSNGNWEFPTSAQWYHVAHGMFDLFCSPSQNAPLRRSPKMDAYANVITHVSKSICSMALPRALDKYEEGLPSYYHEEYHNHKLLQAMSVLSMHVRGPCALETAKNLQEECAYLWASSRQQCEALSLSGRHCIKRVHGDEESHSSNFLFHSACNCGKSQAPRSDPFSVKEANFDYYFRLEDGCCVDNEHWELPFKNPAEKSGEEAGLEVGQASDVVGYNVLTEAEAMKNLSPELPFWSLIHMGPSSKYSHSSGLNQPGFLSNYKHLLSWDIPITKTDLPSLREKWPNLVDTAVKKMTFNPRASRGPELGILAKVFFGCEYECPRGHRFIAHSPSFKAASSSKSSASRGISTRGFGANVAESAMPLYIPCGCSSRRSGSLGQLMRLHVVTPKAPICVNLLPRILPSEGGPVFVSGCEEPLRLPPNTYWIMRLPFLYSSREGGVHLPPLKLGDDNAGKLLKGFIRVTEEFEDD